MEITQLINIISNVGVPVGVMIWFMFRTEKIISANTEAIRQLSQIVATKVKSVTKKT